MKKIVLFFAVCFFALPSFTAPTEIYVAYQLKDGEKVKEIAERFHISIQKLVAYNKHWQTDGIKAGITIRVPTEHIKKVTLADAQGKESILYENKNSYIINENEPINENVAEIFPTEMEMLARNLFININEVNELIVKMKSTSLGNDIILVFSDGSSVSLGSPVDQLNILTSLKRNCFVAQNLNLAFNKK